MDETRIRKIFSDEALVEKLLVLSEPADVQAALKEKGVVATLDEVRQLGALLSKYFTEKAEKGDELSLDQLEDVAGGGALYDSFLDLVYEATKEYGPNLVDKAKNVWETLKEW